MFERIWILLHILAMFTAVAMSFVPEFVMHRVAERGDVRAVRSFGSVYQRIGLLIPVFYVGGAILGLVAVFFNHLDFLQPWLLIAYVLFIINVVLGAGIAGPWAGKLGAAAAKSPEDQPSAEFVAVANDPRARWRSTAAWS